MTDAVVKALPPRDAIAALVARGGSLPSSFAWQDVWEAEHAHAFTVAKSAGFDILAEIHAALVKALSNGQTLDQFAAELRPLLEAKGWWGWNEVVDPLTGERRAIQLGSLRRLRTIFETNMRVSYAAGHWAMFERNKAARPFLRYVAILDDRVRPLHARLHNLVLPVDHPFWAQWAPPNGWGCRCTLQQLSQRDVDRLAAEGETLQLEPPTITARPWTNKRTGEITYVPDGIDPGWAYNPGREGHAAARQAIERKLADGLLLPPAPRQWPPAPSSDAEIRKLTAVLDDDQAEWTDSLTDAELDALASYKANGYRAMNGLLRADERITEDLDDDDIEAAEAASEELSGALARNSTKRPMTTFRGIPRDDAIAYLEARPGAVVADSGFFSSSIWRAMAERVADHVLEVRVGAGVRGVAFVHSVPDINHVEYEVLFRPGMRMRVVENRPGRTVLEILADDAAGTDR